MFCQLHLGRSSCEDAHPSPQLELKSGLQSPAERDFDLLLPSISPGRFCVPSDLPMDFSVTLGHSPSEAIQAEDSLFNEGGGSGFELDTPIPGQANEPLGTAVRMKDLAIGFDGHQYTFAGYRYERFSDAVDYAKLIRSRGGDCRAALKRMDLRCS